MRTINFGSWLQATANLGIIIGLVLVFLQMQQANQIAHAELASRNFELRMSAELAMLGDTPAKAWSKALTSPETMSQQDLLEAIAYLNYYALLYEHNQYLEDIGMFQGVWREDFSVAVKKHLAGNPLSREFLSNLEWGGEWVKEARRHAGTLDGTENADYLADIKQQAARNKTSDGK